MFMFFSDKNKLELKQRQNSFFQLVSVEFVLFLIFFILPFFLIFFRVDCCKQ